MDMHHPTKAQHILYLAKQGLNSKEIARLVYRGACGEELKTRMSYVRVVVRQRRGQSLSQFDRVYLKRTREERNRLKRERYATDPVFRMKCLRSYSKWYRAHVARKAEQQNHFTTA